MRRNQIGALIVLASALVQSTSEGMSANTCSALSALQPSQLKDGQLFYRDFEGHPWVLFAPQSRVSVQGTASFTYVVRAFSDAERTGVVVIKSGARLGAPTADISVQEKSISLHREDNQSSSAGNTAAACTPAPHFQEPASVTAEEYARYHDDGYALGTTKLSTYHFSYPSLKLCKATNDTTADSLFDRRSNRSQFSFDQSVVSSGMHSRLTAFLPFGVQASASGAFAGITNLRVQTIGYTTEGGLACVSFKVPGFDDQYFLRINDLEGRLPVPPYARRGELVWE